MNNITSVAYQGVAGSYSHALSSDIAPEARAVGYLTFEETLQAVEREECDVVLAPIENNIGGRVAEIHQLLNHTSLTIIGERFYEIRHCLLGLPGVDIGEITSVRSHPQALLQCSRVLHSQKWMSINTYDTAHAALQLAENGDRSTAVIASELCASIYGLHILRRDVANDSHNITRFIVLRKSEPQNSAQFIQPITSLLTQVRSVPAALYKSLGGLATSGINLLKIESYVDPINFNIARFYIEMEANILAHHNAHALDELRYYSEWVRVLGVFEADTFRKNIA